MVTSNKQSPALNVQLKTLITIEMYLLAILTQISGYLTNSHSTFTLMITCHSRFKKNPQQLTFEVFSIHDCTN
jgi:hypothetical protein